MGKLILGPIQRRFGPSCARRLYVMCKSTAFHDMQMECQRIKNYHSFFTVLLIYHILLSITKFLTHRSLPNHSPINSWSPPNRPPVCWSCAAELLPFLRGCKLEPSFKYRLTCSCSLFSEWTLKHIYHWRYLRMNYQSQPTKRSASSAESRDTSLTTYYRKEAKRSELPLSFGYNFHIWPARSSLWTPLHPQVF